MRRLYLVLILVCVACGSKKGDKCARVIDKSMKVLGEIAALRGAKLGPKEREQLIKQCRDATKKGDPDPQVDCVLAAKDDAGVRNCYMKGYEQYLERSKEMEAQLQLVNIGKGARTAFNANNEFPKGKVGPSPAAPCCTEQIKQCVPNESMWADPVWQSLSFFVQGTFHFQYTYESDGKTFTATATGDPGCTGKAVTRTIQGKIGADGTPEITKP